MSTALGSTSPIPKEMRQHDRESYGNSFGCRLTLARLESSPGDADSRTSVGRVAGEFYDCRVSSQLPLEPDAWQTGVQEQSRESLLPNDRSGCS